MKHKAALTIIAVVLLSVCAHAADWGRYGNARFNYWIDIPPGFSKVKEPDNGDGGVSTSPQGNAELRVWGGYLTDRDFRGEAKWRIEQDRADGWDVSLQKLQSTWAVWSGAKGDRIFYQRAMPVCDGAAAYFRLEYDKVQLKAFDPIIARLGQSLRSGKC